MVDYASSNVILDSPVDDEEVDVAHVDCENIMEIGAPVTIYAWVAISPDADATGITLQIFRTSSPARQLATVTYDAVAASDPARAFPFALGTQDQPGLEGGTSYGLTIGVPDATGPSPVLAVGLDVRYNYVPQPSND